MSSPNPYYAAATNPGAASVITVISDRDNPACALAMALRIDVHSTFNAARNEYEYTMLFPFARFKIFKAPHTFEYVLTGVVSDTENTFKLSDPVEAFPSKKLVNALNLLRS